MRGKEVGGDGHEVKVRGTHGKQAARGSDPHIPATVLRNRKFADADAIVETLIHLFDDVTLKKLQSKGVQSPKITDICRTWEGEMSVMFLDLQDEIGPIRDGFFNDLLRPVSVSCIPSTSCDFLKAREPLDSDMFLRRATRAAAICQCSSSTSPIVIEIFMNVKLLQ
jgi:hypothetical protein